MARPSVLVAICLVLAALLPGCSGPNGAVRVGLPSLGDKADYEGSDGSRLVVTADRVETRTDGTGTPHDSLIVLFQWTPGTARDRGDASFDFEEAVSLASGRIVQQVARCAIPATSSLASPVACYDERRLVLMAPGGMPGGLGMGPAWGSGLVPASLPLLVDPVDGAVAAVNLVLRSSSRSGCANQEAAEWPQARTIRMLPWTVLGNLTVCPGQPFPERFTGLLPHFSLFATGDPGPVSFHLVSLRRGSEPVEFRTEQFVPAVVALPMWGEPYYVNGVGQASPFTTQEAHATANRDPAYAALMDNGAVVESFSWRNKAGSSDLLGQRQSTTYSGVLVATAATGESREVEVEKIVTATAGMPNTTYRVVAARDLPLTTPPLAIPSQIQIDAATVEAGRLIPGHRLYRAGFTHNLRFETHSWAAFDQDAKRLIGYDLRVDFNQALEGESASTGVRTEIPFRAIFDGPTGAILLFERDVTPPQAP